VRENDLRRNRVFAHRVRSYVHGAVGEVGWGERSEAQRSGLAWGDRRWASLRSPQPTKADRLLWPVKCHVGIVELRVVEAAAGLRDEILGQAVDFKLLACDEMRTERLQVDQVFA
jgi:hypothetical protein